jgi:four helix bundle protein
MRVSGKQERRENGSNTKEVRSRRMPMSKYRGYRDLKVYQLSYRLALEIYEITKTFPIEEKYSLTDQVRRSSRSVPANISEAWKKRRYQKMFISKTVDAAGEAGETEVWLDFARDFGYLRESKHRDVIAGYEEVNKMLFGMIDKADKFAY